MRADIRDGAAMLALMRRHAVDAVVNFAAESHVDRSIGRRSRFSSTNVGGTLACSRRRARQVSVGSSRSRPTRSTEARTAGAFDEDEPARAAQSVAASKAAAEGFVMAFHQTHGLDTVIARCCNNYGPYQFPEKLIPLMILNAIEGQPLPVYGDGLQVRDWIHVDDHCEAVDAILAGGAPARSTTSAWATGDGTWTSSARSCGSPGATTR